MEPELRFIQCGTHRVAVLSGNSQAPGTPLIFLHGIAGSVHFWPELLPPSVRNHRRWHSIGLPGHFPGDSSASDNFTAEAFADVLATVIRTLTPRQTVALIGYSTGGFAALNLAASAPELVSRVLCISGFAVGKWRGPLGRLQSLASHGRMGRSLYAAFWKMFTFNSHVCRRLIWLNAARSRSSATDTEPLLNRVVQDTQQQRAAVLARMFVSIRRFDIRLLLREIQVPTLIAGGNCDPIIPYQHTCELASMIRGAELITFRGVGHLFFVECVELFQEMLEDWVDENCESRGLRCAA